MKHVFRALTIFILLNIPASYATSLDKLNQKYKSAVVMETATGNVLFARDADKKIIPASLVKMMVVLISIEKIQQGQISLSDTYTVSAAASRIGGHQVYLKQGETFTLGELLKATMIGSANDAAYAVAEHVSGGNASVFVDLMNRRADDLNMLNTVFSNVHGLPPNRRKGQTENFSTAYDLALLARRLTRFPLVMRWSSTRLDSFRDGTFQLLNTNHRFLQNVPGADGLKTGYHPRGAGFSMVGSAVRDGRRLLAVVIGSDSSRDRLYAAEQLLEMGFDSSDTILSLDR
jgi:D-alanyl-D-alanine carboxypeptidase (penicillin-binding protein 5/6)